MIAMVFVHVLERLNELNNKTEPRYDIYDIWHVHWVYVFFFVW